MKHFSKLMAIILATVMVLSLAAPATVRAEDWENYGGTNDGEIVDNIGTIDVNNGKVENNGTSSHSGIVTTNNGLIVLNYGTVTSNYGNEVQPDERFDVGIIIKAVTHNFSLICTNYGYIPYNREEATPADTSIPYETWDKGVRINETDGKIYVNWGAVGKNKGTIEINEGFLSCNNGIVETNRADGEVRNGDGGIVTNNLSQVTFDGANAVITNQYSGTVIGNTMSGAITNYFGGVVSGSSITVTNNFADITNDTHVAIQSAENQYRAVHFVAPEHSEVAYSSGFMTKTLMNEDGTRGDTVQYVKQGTDATITIAPEAGYTITQRGSYGSVETEDYAFDYEIDYPEYNVIGITISNYSGNSSSLSLADFGLVERMVAESPDDIHIFRWEKNDNGEYEPVEWTSDEAFRAEVSATDEYDLYLSFGVKNAWENTSGSYILSCPDGIPNPSVDYLAPSPIASLSEDQAGMSAFVHICFNNAHITEWTVSYSADSFQTTRAFNVAAKSVPAPDPEPEPQPSPSYYDDYDPYAPVVTISTGEDGSNVKTTTTRYPDGNIETKIETVYTDGSQKVDVKITQSDGRYTQTITETSTSGEVTTTEIRFTVGSGYTSTETNITYPDHSTKWTLEEHSTISGDYKMQSRLYDAENVLIERHDSKQVTKADDSVVEKRYDKDAEGKEAYKATTAADGSYSGYHAIVDYASNTRTESTLDITADGAATINVLTEQGDSSSEMSLSGTGSKVSLLKFSTTEDIAVVPAEVEAVNGNKYKVDKIEAGALAGGMAIEAKLEGKATLKANALRGSHINTIKVEKKATFKKNCFKGCENMTIIVESEELASKMKKQLKKSGAKNVKVKVAHSE